MGIRVRRNLMHVHVYCQLCFQNRFCAHTPSKSVRDPGLKYVRCSSNLAGFSVTLVCCVRQYVLQLVVQLPVLPYRAANSERRTPF